ncbi:MAG: hypothetical protein QGH45_24275, partial [Myxococcota bacterium]|nr:hypothetical protein [Myxococcota bacterium]
ATEPPSSTPFLLPAVLCCVAAVVTPPSSAGASGGQAWEALTLQPGLAFTPPMCSRFVAAGGDEHSGQSCQGLLLGAFGLQVRPVRPLLIEAEVMGGIWYDSDSEVLHFMVDEDPGTLPWTDSNGEFRVAAGLGLGLAQGEMRLTAGPRFSLSRISRRTLTSLGDAGLIPDTTGQDHLAVEVGWALDGVPAPPIRLGPRFAVSVGGRMPDEVNEAFEEEWQEFYRVKSRYTSINLRPGFGMSIPGEGPIAFSFELAPTINVRTYDAATFAELTATNPGDEMFVQQTTTDIGGYLFVGLQIRLGEVGS